MTHPFVKIVSDLERSLKKRLEGLDDEAGEIEKNLIEKRQEMTDYESKLSILAKHSSNGFVELDKALNVQPVCPVCFVFHNNSSELKCIPGTETIDRFECSVCHRQYEIEP
jgi:hypothetical protein